MFHQIERLLFSLQFFPFDVFSQIIQLRAKVTWHDLSLQDCVDKAKKLIDDAIANAKEKSGHNPNACTLKVPHELIGMLIGRGGETIKDSVCFRVLDRWHPCVILYLSSCFGFSMMLCITIQTLIRFRPA